MTNYTLLKTEEEILENDLKNKVKCCISYLYTTQDSQGHVWPFVGCPDYIECKRINFCRKIRLLIEEEMN